MAELIFFSVEAPFSLEGTFNFSLSLVSAMNRDVSRTSSLLEPLAIGWVGCSCVVSRLSIATVSVMIARRGRLCVPDEPACCGDVGVVIA